MSGYNQGQWIALPANVGLDEGFYPRPTHTYYVGVHDGALAADDDNNDDGAHYCAPGHTQEYCIGHQAGYSVEEHLINDA